MRKYFSYFLFLFIVSVLGFAFSPFASSMLLKSGLLAEEVPISGTGSMYPTFPKSEGVSEEKASRQTVAIPQMKRYPAGFKLFGREYFTYQLKRGDIVEFENELTRKITEEKYGEATGFVKRVVALPGDTIELRDGYLYLNGEVVSEAYTAKPRSTYGGEFLPDCQLITIPGGSVFVLGDNRKASNDSRHDVGFVEIADINHVLSYSEQEKYQDKWRDPKDDLKFANTTSFDRDVFLSLLNGKREAAGVSLLKYDNLLEKSSSIRGNTIIATDDFSTEATRSGTTLSKAVREAGYWNVLFAEVFTRGFYEADELIENLEEFPDTAQLLLSDEYQDIGFSAAIGEINSCPTQVIVTHLGGYKPPEYEKEDIESWKTLIDNLAQVIPSWEKARGAQGVNQDKLNTLLSLMQQRLSNARRIYEKLSQNQWLTTEENKLVAQDQSLNDQIVALIEELNRQG